MNKLKDAQDRAARDLEFYEGQLEDAEIEVRIANANFEKSKAELAKTRKSRRLIKKEIKETEELIERLGG